MIFVNLMVLIGLVAYLGVFGIPVYAIYWLLVRSMANEM